MITIVSGVPGCGAPLILKMLEAGGMPVFTRDNLPSSLDDPAAFVAPPSFNRTTPDMTWLADAEGRVCRMDWTHLVHLPASREFRIVFVHRNLNDLPACRPTPPTPANSREPRPPEVVYQALERQLWRVTRWLDGPRQIAVHYCDTIDIIEQPMVVIRQLEEFLGLRLNRQTMIVVANRHRLELAPPPESQPTSNTGVSDDNT